MKNAFLKNGVFALGLMVSIPAMADWSCTGFSDCSCGNGSGASEWWSGTATGSTRESALSEARRNSFNSCRTSGIESQHVCVGYECTCDIVYTNSTCTEN